MLDKVKRFIEKIKTKIFYINCYNTKERLAVAVFGMCSGSRQKSYKDRYCLSCPYFREVNENAR